MRAKHAAKGEITQADYAQIRADARFLAIENPEAPEFEAPPVQAPKAQVQSQARK
jgi:hypothetical protein